MKEKKIESDKMVLVRTETISQKILEIRGCKVLLDSDLAELYGVETKVFNQSVSRNIKRFPKDFGFQLTRSEFDNLRSQIVTSSSKGHGGRRTLPYVFTEQCAAMLSGVMNSERAIEVHIGIMRAFVGMRAMIATTVEIKQKLAIVETELGKHSEHFKKVFAALRLLMKHPNNSKTQIGYVRESGK